MKQLLLIDGNSLLFRAYYATVYGRMMRTSNGIATNAVFAFINMVNKALDQIDPDYVLVAWDAGKQTFRHKEYTDYKGTRKELDEDLIVQFPIAREFLDACGLYRYECDALEADDIIGCSAKRYPDMQVHILSSDRDLLQLVDATTDVYLMKKGISDMMIVDEAKMEELYGLKPMQIIDLKGLMGDASDNIPGIKGVGEKTALKLLHAYESVEGVYAHLDEIKGKIKEKLEDGKESAFLSKHLATIVTDQKLPFSLEELRYEGYREEVQDFYQKYEMRSFAHKSGKKLRKVEAVSCQVVQKIDTELLQRRTSFFLDVDNESLWLKQCFGMAIGNEEKMEYIAMEDLLHDEAALAYLKGPLPKCTYDCKQAYHMFARYGIAIEQLSFDYHIAAFLLDGTLIDYERFANHYGIRKALNMEEIYGKEGKPKLADESLRVEYVSQQLAGMIPLYEDLVRQLKETNMWKLFEEVEMPLVKVLYEMERNGVATDLQVLSEIEARTAKKIEEISASIYACVGHEFNLNSPKQLAIVLFDELGLKASKKRSTAIDVLEKLTHAHPVVPLLMEHRKYQKLYSTYAVALAKHVQADGKIHTIFHQTLTQTGRLSSSDPNLQNISVRDEESREVRKAFVASEGCVLLAADYSQIELRMLAHMAEEQEMIDAYNHGVDIHTKTAMQIFDVAQEEVTPQMRRSAKTVNFGIVYGQSEFGLAQQLNITRAEAKTFMDRYFASYPGIHAFMDRTIAFCEENGYVETLLHRRRIIQEIREKNYMVREFGKRAAMNAPIQGSAADLIKIAMIDVFHEMKKRRLQSKMILQVHDELIFDVVKEELEEMLELVKERMEHAMQLSVPLVASIDYGSSWYEAK